MGHLGSGGGQRLIVELLGRFGIKRQVKLIFPAELEAGL